MSTVHDELPTPTDAPRGTGAALPEDGSNTAKGPDAAHSDTAVVSKTWIVLGGLAVVLGILMGFVMSSLGK